MRFSQCAFRNSQVAAQRGESAGFHYTRRRCQPGTSSRTDSRPRWASPVSSEKQARRGPGPTTHALQAHECARGVAVGDHSKVAAEQTGRIRGERSSIARRHTHHRTHDRAIGTRPQRIRARYFRGQQQRQALSRRLVGKPRAGFLSLGRLDSRMGCIQPRGGPKDPGTRRGPARCAFWGGRSIRRSEDRVGGTRRDVH